MVRKIGVLGVAVAALGLAACGGSDTPTGTVASSTERGTLVDNPALRVASLNAAAFTAQLNATSSGPQLIELAGTPTCGVDFYYFKYWTVAPNGSAQMASGALMVPTGTSAPCTGPRPIVLYAHGTTTDSAYNIADISDASNSANSEAATVATVFAAQGYIVVAPNYLGYDISTLGYHPYVVGATNATDMMDALTAARTALLSAPGTSDSGKLYVTGYSEGGYVAMATVRAMQVANETVTASAPSSGPYALEAFGDALMFGQVDLGSTEFAPLLTISFQNVYGNVYTQPSDVYSSTYATGIGTLLPSTTPIATMFQNGTLPETALFDSTTPTSSTGISAVDTAADELLALPGSPPYSAEQVALFDLGFGNPYLVNNSYRVTYVDDAVINPDQAEMTLLAGGTLTSSDVAPATTSSVGLRKDFAANDMRSGWAPEEPMLMCGGDADPTVYFQNTQIMAALWSPYVQGGLVTVLDLNGTPQAGNPFAPLQVGLQQTEAQLVASEGASAIASYHSTELPFCLVAARGFFAQVP
jgi:hypothetical protein